MSAGIDPTQVKAILFDIDGTLVETDDFYVRRLARFLSPLRHHFAEHDPTPFSRRLIMFAETPINVIFTTLDRLKLDDLLASLSSTFKYRQGRTPFRDYSLVTGVRAMLRELHRHYPLAILTARRESSALALLDQFQLRSFFSYIASADTCPRSKPHPAPFLWISAKLDIAPQACLIVGDTTVDIRSGKAVGAQTVGVLSGFGEQKELLEAGADLILESPADLPDHLLPAHYPPTLAPGSD
jgi:HAD superfamily hydrolase (TIGR01509 family)